MKTIALYWNGRNPAQFVGYGLSADDCRRVLLGYQNGEETGPFSVDGQCLAAFTQQALASGYRIVIDHEGRR